MNVDQHITELLASRICHGLAATVGAAGNGVELIEEFDDTMRDEAMSLIAMSAHSASNQLKFFRMAYGSAGHDGLASLAEVKRLGEGIVDLDKFAFDWTGAPSELGSSLEPGIGKVLLLMIELASESLMRDGTISISWEDANLISVSAQGKGASVEDNLSRVLLGGAGLSEMTARTAHAYYARTTAQALDAVLVCEQTEDTVIYKLER